MFTWPCKTNFTTVPDPLELQILLEDQTATEILFQSYAATTTIDRMTWLACISHYVRGHVHKIGHNYNGTEANPLLRTRGPYSSLEIVFATSPLSESLGQTNTVIPIYSGTFNNTHLGTTATVYCPCGHSLLISLSLNCHLFTSLYKASSHKIATSIASQQPK